MKQLTTIILLLCVGVVFGQWHPIEAGKGVIITEKDGMLSIFMDTTKPCDRCPKFALDSFIPTLDTIYVVSYDLVERQPLPNDPIETVDKFGRKTYDTYLLYRYKKIYNRKQKIFVDKKEASDFYIEAKSQIDIENLSIDTHLRVSTNFKSLKQ